MTIYQDITMLPIFALKRQVSLVAVLHLHAIFCINTQSLFTNQQSSLNAFFFRIYVYLSHRENIYAYFIHMSYFRQITMRKYTQVEAKFNTINVIIQTQRCRSYSRYFINWFFFLSVELIIQNASFTSEKYVQLRLKAQKLLPYCNFQHSTFQGFFFSFKNRVFFPEFLLSKAAQKLQDF